MIVFDMKMASLFNRRGISNLISRRIQVFHEILRGLLLLLPFCNGIKFSSTKISRLLPSLKLCTCKHLKARSRDLQFLYTTCTKKLENNFPGIIVFKLKEITVLSTLYVNSFPVI